VTARTRPCNDSTIRGRLRKAEQFLEAAELIRELAEDEMEVGDVYVTLVVHAGIAASDVVCCIDLEQHARGDSHDEAVLLLSRVRPDGDTLAKALRGLLAVKTRAGYGSKSVTAIERRRAGRQAERLLRGARERRIR
jgi:hypothetical protein